ncbi:MAG: hypothetical protein K2X82_19880 [Gemmataceae bacterium]|nr:hypothetical protein [Gemmataceae bacterium]
MRVVDPRWGTAVCLAGLAALTASCAGDGRERVYAVTGRVVHRGKPAEGAMVILHTVEGDEKRALKPFGRAGADGTFRITTYTTNDGAAEGEYVVTLVWPTPPAATSRDMEEGPDRLNGRLADPKTSKWRVKVGKAPVELEPFTID